MLVRGFLNVSISRAGMRNDVACDLKYGAHFNLDNDIRELFPYINGYEKKARYHYHPLHIQFVKDKVLCTLYPTEAMAAPFRGRDHAIAFIEELIGYLNDLHARRSELTPSYRLYRQPPSIVDILKTLPRTNCRKCGHATCVAFASALREGKAAPADCPGFAKPISVCTVYPVIEDNGTISSTFSIETENPIERKAAGTARNGCIEKESCGQEASGNQATHYDPYGIRIQYDLTPREIEVLRLVAEGASNQQISHKLHISPHTVKSHIIHIFNKLNCNDRTRAAVWATRNQVI